MKCDKLYLHSTYTIMTLGKLPVGTWKVTMYCMIYQILHTAPYKVWNIGVVEPLLHSEDKAENLQMLTICTLQQGCLKSI